MLTKELAQQLDFFIRSGQVHRAAREIYSIFKTGKIQDTEKSTLANLARRSGLPLLSLKILTPLVSKDKQGLRLMNNAETLSYAAGLIALGAHQEGQELLLNSQMKSENQKWFFLGISAMNQWEYKKSKDYFQNYLKDKSLTHYQTQTARLNLATSMLVIGDHEAAIETIQQAEKSIHPVEEKLLHSYFAELKVQWMIATKKYPQALEEILKIQNQLEELPLNYQLTIKKWKLASLFYSEQISESDLSNELNSLELEAHQRSMPELLREIDFYRCLFLKDKNAYHRIYYGTSWKSYLIRMEENLGQRKHQSTFTWIPRPWQKINPGSKQDFSFEMQHPQNFRYNSLQHKLLWILSSDLYRQHSLGSLFHSLYPDEKFNPWTSKDRLMKLIQRTQSHLNENCKTTSIQVVSNRNRYYLRFDCALELSFRPYHLPTEIRQDPLLIAIYANKKYQTFTNKDVRKISHLSESQTLEDLQKFVSRGLLRQEKISGRTTYSLPRKLLPLPSK